MILLKETMENLLHGISYPLKSKYEDAELNRLLNYWLVLDENSDMIQELTGEGSETILYSKYYWSSRYIDRYTELYGTDAGLEQMRHKILDQMDSDFEINWEMIQKLEEDNYREERKQNVCDA